MASPDNAAAVALNPAALGALPSWSLTYSHVDAARGTSFRDKYDGAWLAAPLGDSFALGGGIDFTRARDGSGASANGAMLAAALGGPAFSLGTSWRMRSPRIDRPNIHTADVALAWRPSPTLAVSLIGRDLAVGDRVLGTRKVRENGLLAVGLRPLGDDRLGLDLGGRVDAAGNLGLRVAALGMVPYVGRVGAAAETIEIDGRQQWTVTAGLDVRLGGLSLAPAVHVGEHADDVGWSLLADVHGTPRVGVPGPRVVWKVPLRGLGARRLLGVARTLERALHDPRVQGVVLVPQGANLSLASAQELRMAIAALEAADKPVYCYLQSATGAEFYACSGARRIAIDPAGSVRLMGIGGASLYFGELLRNVGLRADFVRIGTYKSAPEQYTNDHASEPAREVRTALLDHAYRRLTSDLSVDLGLSEKGVQQLIDRGPFLAQEAMREKLTAAEVDPSEVERDGQVVFGKRARVSAPTDSAREPTFGPTGQVGVVVIDGTIVDGENVDVPLFDMHMSGGRTIADAIDKLAGDGRIRAIVLRIDSPGGAVMASDQIWRAVRRARAKKPVIASMGDVAASGGYYAAAGADEIWALPSTITGSIGIFYGKVDVAQLAAKIGVGIEHDQRGAHMGADSLFRPFSEDERATLADKLRIWYRQFLERVSEGRKLPIEKVDALARGRVYSGDEAHELGLVDQLGGFASALARARELGRVPLAAELVVVPKIPSNLLDYVVGGGARSEASAVSEALPPALKALAQRVYPWARIDSATPMALYEGPLRLE